ncbi:MULTISPECIES: aspartyl protease family protein [Butyricimonas]|uniref:aspartyl protease family protein n=1 Tax=Butyricimonas TaxID=574697 RepID=UPI0007FB3B59|nr:MULTISPECIES: aspartyl protease family protein [Butyricimonas]
MKKKLIFAILFSFVILETWAQQGKAVIPYRLVGGKMIIEMFVNGTSRNFIFDTGGQTSLSPELCKEMGLTPFQSIQVKDANSKDVTYPLVLLESLATPDKGINFAKVPVLEIGHFSFDCFGVVGLIGSDLFASMIVEIDGKNKLITVTTAEKQAKASLRRSQPFVDSGRMPLIGLKIGTGNMIKVLFDTGSSGFLGLKIDDYEKLLSAGILKNVVDGYGEGGLSVGGMAAQSEVHRVGLPDVSFGKTRFTGIATVTSKAPYTLLGTKLLEYGKVTIDYSRKLFYFEANEEINSLSREYPDFDIRVKDGDLVVSVVWEKMKGILDVGDKVLKINGKRARKYDFCESITKGIPELKVDGPIKMTIQTKEGKKVISYKK